MKTDTLTDGKAVVRQWLTSHGLTLPELVLENGAGLSRNGSGWRWTKRRMKTI